MVLYDSLQSDLLTGTPTIIRLAHGVKVHPPVPGVLPQSVPHLLTHALLAPVPGEEQPPVVLLDGYLAAPQHQHIVRGGHRHNSPVLDLRIIVLKLNASNFIFKPIHILMMILFPSLCKIYVSVFVCLPVFAHFQYFL